MSEVNTTQTPPTAPLESSPADSVATPHMSNLPRMSATAGAGSQEYVAINVASILGLLLGIGSLLAFMSPVLLFIPLFGLVVSIAACRQIGRSNGTETGLN